MRVSFGVFGFSGLTELDVVSFEVEDLGATEDSVVFKVGSSDGGSVVRNHQELAVALSQRLLGLLESCAQSEGK